MSGLTSFIIIYGDIRANLKFWIDEPSKDVLHADCAMLGKETL